MYAQPTDNDKTACVDAANGVLEQWDSLVSQQQGLLSQILEENKKLKTKLKATEAQNLKMRRAIETLVSGSPANFSKVEQEEASSQSDEEIPVKKSKQDKPEPSEKNDNSTVSDDPDELGFQPVGKKKKHTRYGSSRLLKPDMSSTRSESSAISSEQALYRPPSLGNRSRKGGASSQGGDRPPGSRKPCNVHYLIGQCQLPECEYEHGLELSQAEIQRLKNGAKRQPCKYVNENKECWEEKCIYGHKCPHRSKCRYRASKSCRFVGSTMHEDDSDSD
ncbi:hypothetical protein FRC14_007311 [Serendipita sp. 396]|nr:hypothetical protein FRC14_007311 [Serendipita sp. 396]KAG8786535.1 hypothetical protein FRC15_011254 [Serendipita sp. 397]KAG8870832.1 hypothetical protein FRC20_011283 [Serendipita sp. 405]KAG9054461.1 hypothetical protein FS842_005034 [Serendipita sp. 407]